MKKYNEAGVPITWSRLCMTRIFFEKKVNYPPWSLKTKVTILVPMKSKDNLISEIENSIS